MLDVLQQEYITTARAKGLAQPVVIRDALRNSRVPVVMVGGLQFGALLSLRVGVVAAVFTAVCGSSLGLLAGYYGGAVDALIGRIIDVHLAFLGILLAMVIVAVLDRRLRK